MARRKYKKDMNKIEPSEMTLTFATPVTSSGTIASYYIDLSQVASIVNRRFYRQGINWAVSGFKFLVGSGLGSVMIQKLPNTWVMSNSWEKGFRHWNRQQKESLEESSESVRAKFSDFKIYADSEHLAAGVAANLLPLAGNSAIPATPGEWQMSQIVVPNFLGAAGTNIEPQITAVGDADLSVDPTQFSLIEAYANSRSVPQSPDPAVPAGVTSGPENIYRQMFDVGANDDVIMDNAVYKNDDLPYPQDTYPGGGTQLPGLAIHDQASYTASTIGGITYAKGGNFPCGLIKVIHSVPEGISHNLVMMIDLVPGSHRGYMCEPMTEM